MLRLIKHHLTGINGVEIYPLFSLLIFTVFFALVLIRVIRMKKGHVSEVSHMPLDNDGTTQTNPE